MLTVTLDEVRGIALLEPVGKLSAADFESAATVIDPYIEKAENLKGIIIHVKSFPGWESFGALLGHMKFAHEHHKKVVRIAFATDSPIGGIAEHVLSHFVNAEIKNFDFDELEESKSWITASNPT